MEKGWISLSVLQHDPFCWGIDWTNIVPWPVSVERLWKSIGLKLLKSCWSQVYQPIASGKLLWPDTWLEQLGWRYGGGRDAVNNRWNMVTPTDTHIEIRWGPKSHFFFLVASPFHPFVFACFLTVPGLFSAWRCHVPWLSKMDKLVGISVVSTGVISQLFFFHSHVAKSKKSQHHHWVWCFNQFNLIAILHTVHHCLIIYHILSSVLVV